MKESFQETGNQTGRIFVVDDDRISLKNLRRILEKAGYKVFTFSNPLRALIRLEQDACDLLITDLKMPFMNGLDLFNRAQRVHPSLEGIIITGYANLEGAIEATKEGAFYYLAKPFHPEQLKDLVTQALQQKFIREPLSGEQKNPGEHPAGPVMIGNSPGIGRVKEMVAQIAPAECSVLITGESGTGKELVAHAIHAQSARAGGPFVAFNCGAFSEDLIANELFGHEKEAFTGAHSRKAGLIENAEGGALFLDEIGDMPLSMQVKLLRVIQEREVLRVGSSHPVAVNVRFLAATAKDLKAAVREGVFRQDLYFRLNVVEIRVPRLSERQQDIPLLAYHLLSKFLHRTEKRIQGISAEALELLKAYPYPGNVRELENILERAVTVCNGKTILGKDLPSDLVNLDLYTYERPDGLHFSLEELERDYIQHILKLTGGIRVRTAEILGIDRASLWRKMKKYNLG
ncbi:MAG TPA: sigma-54-dependent Fis family transcriptional regulator [Deltaproteobacteria bacterium]|nr:sigma-54-dependent Fis family transcriptional regulator [Deltaproteobacteria bacterium]